jgi:hypothetical protein
MEQQPDLFATFGAVFIVLAILFGLIVVVVAASYNKRDDDPIDKEL